MRCFFHLVNDYNTLLDDTGVEVFDLDVAKAHARTAIGELQQEDNGAAADWPGWRLDIVCPEGSLLHSLPLQAVFH
jgi:hypothetical protein